MYENKGHFYDDFLFYKQDVATGTDAPEGAVRRLGQTQGGILIRGYTEGAVTCASGDTITATLKGADSETATAWETIASQTATATGTSFSGDFFKVIPDTELKFMKLEVSNSTGMSGKFSAAIEYKAR